MASDMDEIFSCIFNLCDVRMRKAIYCSVPRGYIRGPPGKKKSVSVGSFIRGKSVKQELKTSVKKTTQDVVADQKEVVPRSVSQKNDHIWAEIFSRVHDLKL